MTKLSVISGLAAPSAVVDTNFELLDRQVFHRKADLVSGVAVTTMGAPTMGTHVLDELHRDVKAADWICTVAGTPGTWKQYSPAIVDANPSGTIPDGYWIIRRDLNWRQYTYNLGGTAWVERLCGRLSASLSLDFPSIAASGGTQDLTITVTGAVTGDGVVLGMPTGTNAGVTFNAWVSAADTVTVRATNCTAGAIDPAAATFRAVVVPQ